MANFYREEGRICGVFPLVFTLLVLIIASTHGEPSAIMGSGGPPLDDDDVGSVLINTLHASVQTTTAPTPGATQHVIPDVEWMKLKAATKGAGLSDAKAERVLRAVRALDLKYHEVVDLKKVMMNPATSADYAERVRRALEDAVVDSNMKNSQYDTVASEHLPRNAINNADNNNHMASISNRVGKTWAGLAQSDLYSPFGKRSARAAGGSPTPDLMGGPHVFFGTPLTAPALPEDLDNLWVLASHIIPRKEAFELVQQAYLLKLTRSQVFDLQTEFASGKMTLTTGLELLEALKAKAALGGAGSPVTPPPQQPQQQPDLSQPLDVATLQRLQTVAELSGLDRANSTRLVRAVQNSGLAQEQVDLLGEAIQTSAPTGKDLDKLVDHLEETDFNQAYAAKKKQDGKRGVDSGESRGDEFLTTPEQAKGADWIYDQGIDNQHEQRNLNNDWHDGGHQGQQRQY
ncbi:uncharacterized protein LOC110858732 [Folsomia candida]|uniref:Uncharacterized protein n=1 Tax=Folsomia candida TaxID=158441 RepID=A0A226DE01_FOLCA|nr:uncharacterized protein LOC110858732 [Folsomia candida]OXA43399.1 hypothetical protein Fcan01_21844 [Folsomia candida]